MFVILTQINKLLSIKEYTQNLFYVTISPTLTEKQPLYHNGIVFLIFVSLEEL